MELSKTILDEENEQILSKLDNTIGISQNKEVLRDIIKYSQVMKKYDCHIEFENYNIIIRNKSAYNLYEELISVIAELYYKNGITLNPDVIYIDRNDFRYNKLKNEDIEQGIIVINLITSRRDNSEMKQLIENMIEQMPTKAFIILEDYFCEGEVNAMLNEYFSWSMKIDVISNEEKEKYIKKFMDSNELICSDKIIKELAEEPYYKIKNKVINFLVNCKINNESDVSKLLKDDKKTQRREKETNKKAIEELEELTGLEEVKDQIRKVVNFLKVSKNRKNLPMLHMTFNGNPGTGKTTIARIVGKIFAEENILSQKEKFVEIHGRDLVAKYVGWTSANTKEKIKEADGGVLFIDEAYSLISDRRGGFEQEAIDTLLKEMEDKRDKVCVIMAGYQNKMQELIEMNPGFKSRIQFEINFPDYSSEELYNIFKSLCKKENYKISSNIKQILLQHFDMSKKEENFSNARYVRNIFEKVKIEQANRVITKKENENLIKKYDIEYVLKEMKNKETKQRNIIGFCT